MHKKMPATTWLAWVHVFNYFTCLLDRGASLNKAVLCDKIAFLMKINNIRDFEYFL